MRRGQCPLYAQEHLYPAPPLCVVLLVRPGEKLGSSLHVWRPVYGYSRCSALRLRLGVNLGGVVLCRGRQEWVQRAWQ